MVANGESATTSEDTAKDIDVLSNDTDDDGATLNVGSFTNGTHGTVTKSTDGTKLIYTPAPNYNGSDSFTYTASDGKGGESQPATVELTVTAVNDAPVANDQSVSTNEDTDKSVTLGATDADSDTLAFSVLSGPSHGTLSGTAPNLTYHPDADYNGSDSFTYKANDGSADSNTATVSITVNPVNDAPTITVAAGGSCSSTSVSGTMNLTVQDADAIPWR